MGRCQKKAYQILTAGSEYSRPCNSGFGERAPLGSIIELGFTSAIMWHGKQQREARKCVGEE